MKNLKQVNHSTKYSYFYFYIDRTFSTGAYVGMVIGSIIFMAIIAGVIHAAYQKHKRTAVKDIIKAAYKEDIAQREKERNISAVAGNDVNVIITPVKYE